MKKAANNNKRKIGIYSPYWDILGGGEKYLFTIAQALSESYDVTILGEHDIRKESFCRFGLKLDKVNFLFSGRIFSADFLHKLIGLGNFDIFIYLTDGSLFFSPAKKNILVIQSPKHIPQKTVLNKIKLKQYKIICYSEFMKKIIFEKLGKNASVLPPMIDPEIFKSQSVNKENIILTVGRFFRYPHAKKQEVLVEAFTDNYKKQFRNWRFVVAGGLTENDEDGVISKIRKKISGFPVELVINPSFLFLLQFYKKAKIYWHAAGFSEDLQKFPEKAEHFGITTVEAMSCGCVPVVYPGGGQKEIVADEKNGYYFQSIPQLISKTAGLINDNSLYSRISRQARLSADNYSPSKFYERLEKII